MASNGGEEGSTPEEQIATAIAQLEADVRGELLRRVKGLITDGSIRRLGGQSSRSLIDTLKRTNGFFKISFDR